MASILKGALIQLENSLVSVEPNVIIFDINPEKFTHKLTPWNPFEGDQALRGAQAPNVQPFDPKESYDFDVELDSSVAGVFDDGTGVASQIAAYKKLTMPSQGIYSDLVNAVNALTGGSSEAARPTVPVILFAWGPGLIVPVRISSFQVDVSEFNNLLFPVKATIKLSLEVLTPDLFKCRHDSATDLAIAAYKTNKIAENALAALQLVKRMV